LYRFSPLFAGRSYIHDKDTWKIEGLRGHCFDDITITTYFEYLNKQKTKVKASITLEFISSPYYLCAENILIGTTFKDYYNFYVNKGVHGIEIEFTEDAELIDLHKSGLRFFFYCADAFEMISSSFMTGLLWAGGVGNNHLLPIFGTRPTDY